MSAHRRFDRDATCAEVETFETLWAPPRTLEAALTALDTGPRPSRTTLAMLAGEAGVSLSTISKVLNGHSDVAPATRQRVEQLLDAHAYRRRGSASRESSLLELVFSDLSNPWGSEILTGVQRVAQERGLSLVLSPSGTRGQPDADWLSGVLRRKPVAVLLVSTEPAPRLADQLTSRSIPFAVIDPAGELPAGVASVGSTNWAGGLAATRHVIQLGHTRIAAISGPDRMLCSLARLDGFRSAMSSARLPVRDDWVRTGEFQTEGGRVAAQRMLAGSDRPTAVVAGNDLQAIGVIGAATELGLRVPEDLSVVGYDDATVAEWARPALTTVHQPIRRMAAEATRIVLRLADGERVEQQRLELATHLVVRCSTAPPA